VNLGLSVMKAGGEWEFRQSQWL